MEGLLAGLLLPVVGTTLGSACVFFMGKSINGRLYRLLLGFAAGVMVAASVWSLLIPAIEMGEPDSPMRVVPAVVGFLSGMGALLALDKLTTHMHMDNVREGPRSHMSRTMMLVMAVTIHNIPEGLAVGVSLAGAMEHDAFLPLASALTLSLGIAIQNFPEGAIVSMPLRGAGNSRLRAFWLGTASGLVEPVAALATIGLAWIVVPILPYLLAFAAGAMLYVVFEELVPTASEGEHSNMGVIGFAIGFALMMVLDVMLG